MLFISWGLVAFRIDVKVRVSLLVLVGGWWVGGEKTKLMLYSTLVEVEVELGKTFR